MNFASQQSTKPLPLSRSTKVQNIVKPIPSDTDGRGKRQWHRAGCLEHGPSVSTQDYLIKGRQVAQFCCKATGSRGGQTHGRDEEQDSNQLQTALNNAIKSEDYVLAGQLSQSLRDIQGPDADLKLDWKSLGCLEWLAERAEQLGYNFPTGIQRRCCATLQCGAQDIIIESETGSGKTLAFVMPMLSQLDYPPALFPEDLRGPQMIVLVPSMELGVQEAMLIYKLFGGSVNPGIPGASANMFAYSGPRGLKVRGLLTGQEVLMSKTLGFLRGAHVLIATPTNLAEVMRFQEFRGIFDNLKAIAIDEADACFKMTSICLLSSEIQTHLLVASQTQQSAMLQDHAGAMAALMTEACAAPNRRKPAVAVVGATLDSSLATQGVQMGWLVDPMVVASAERSGTQHSIPKGLVHRYIKVDESRKLAVLCRHLRADFARQGDDVPPPRVIVFADTEEAAKAAATPLRNALWGKHKLAVLLPHGDEPIKAMHDFRDNAATFLLATPAASRGLDLPAVSHIYNLGCPDVTTYLHQAGRAGRIGSPVRGVITSIISESESEKLKAVAKELDLKLIEETALEAKAVPDPEADVDAAKKELEDLYNLL